MLLSHLFKSPSVVRWNDITILWRITRNHKSPKTINCDFICPKSFNFSCITMSQASNFPKCNAFFFDLNQGFTTIKHWIIKPSPWAWLIISKFKKKITTFLTQHLFNFDQFGSGFIHMLFITFPCSSRVYC